MVLQFFMAGLIGSFIGAAAVMATIYLAYKAEMSQRKKVSKELEVEFNNIINSLKGLEKGPTKGSKLH